jgi:hypothetical protein
MDASLVTLSPEHARTGCGSGAAKSKLRQKEVLDSMQGARRRGATDQTLGWPKGSVHARLKIGAGDHHALFTPGYKTNCSDL